MAISTFTELKSAVATWLARSDLTSQIPEFIVLAEAKFNRDLRCNQMEQRATASVNLANSEPEFIALPTDFQTMRRVRLSGVTGKPRLSFLTGTQADEYRYGRGDATGQPAYFTIFGDELELLPTPDTAFTIEMVYRSKIEALSDSNTSNWLLALAPDAYLYGTLVEAAAFNQDDARLVAWGTGYQNAINGLNRLAMDQAYNAGPMTMTMSGVTP